MLLGFLLLFVLITEVPDKVPDEAKKYKYTLTINPLSFILIPVVGIFDWIPGINFELRIVEKFSINFELNNSLLVYPAEIEIGIREYLGKKGFMGFYLYQGLGGIIRIAGAEPEWTFVPSLILTAGYKSISPKGFTIDPFVGIRILIFRFIPLPALGLYLGYSW